MGIKVIFAAFRRYPGLGLYVGFGKFIKPKFKFDRNGFVIMLLGLYIVGSFYDFIESSSGFMAELIDLRNDNAMIRKIYAGRPARRKP